MAISNLNATPCSDGEQVTQAEPRNSIEFNKPTLVQSIGFPTPRAQSQRQPKFSNCLQIYLQPVTVKFTAFDHTNAKQKKIIICTTMGSHLS